MFTITKLSSSSQLFISTLMQLNKSRSIQASLALAKVFVNRLNLPSSPVEDPLGYYRAQCQMEIENELNSLNELIVLDIKTIRDYCTKMFQQRYNAAHPSSVVFTFNKETAIEDFFGITRVFDKATLDAIKEDPPKLAMYVNGFSAMLEEMKA